MDGVEDGEVEEAEETSGRRISGINIYCVCCSKQVESGTSLGNKLCEHCIAVMDNDGDAGSSAHDEMVLCKLCGKGFSRHHNDYNRLCWECMSVMLRPYENQQGVIMGMGPCRVCRRLFSQPVDTKGEGTCPSCQHTPKQVYPRWADIVTLQGYTAVVAKTMMHKYFYEWCEGHRAGNEAQEAHQCMEQSYATQTLRKICSHLCPHSIVKMIHAMQMSEEVKLGKGAARVVSKALWCIFIADDPFQKMKEYMRGCPACTRTRLEGTAGKWGNRLCPMRSRDKWGATRRRLFH